MIQGLAYILNAQNVRNLEQNKWLLTDKCLCKLKYIHKIKFYIGMKMNSQLLLAKTWMNLKIQY